MNVHRHRGPLAALLLAAAVAIGAALLAPAGDAAPVRGCASFASQSDAQAHFFERGGRPHRKVGGVGRLDGDRDGVACEGAGPPYAGYASLSYHKRKRFLFGYAWLPPDAADPSRFACLYGNRHFADGPRLLNVYRIVRGKPRPLRRRGFEVASSADPASGELVWKLPLRRVRGRYFVAFEARVPLSPFGAVECPGFRSPTVNLSKLSRRR